MVEHIASFCKQASASLKKTAASKLNQGSSKKRKTIDSSDSEDEDAALESARPQATSETTGSVSPPSSTCRTSDKPTTSHSSNGSMDRFVVSTSERLKVKIDKALARAVYMTPSVPFNIFENVYWKHALNLLRPSYKPPSRHQIGTPLLNQEYDDVMVSAKKNKIKAAPCIAIISDGWTNNRNESLINFLLTTPLPVFFKSITPGKDKETASYIGKEIINVIDEVVSDGTDVKLIFIVITDNAANMRAAWDIVREKYPHIVCIGCPAHMLNLLLGDIMKVDSLKELRCNVKKVIKQFKNHHVPGAFFKAEQKVRYGNKAVTLKLPPKTRWFFFVISLYSLISNKAALQSTVIEEELAIDSNVRELVLDNAGFWVSVTDCYNLLVPIAKAISHVESDTALLSDLPFLTKKVSHDIEEVLATFSLLTSEEKTVVNSAVVDRMYKCCFNVHFAANLLHPMRMGKDLDQTEKQDAIRFISEQCIHLELNKGEVLGNLAAFRTKTGSFGDENIWEAAAHTTPATWWGGFCTEQPLFPIAARVFNVPITSAPCERNWSTFSSVHTKTKNRILNERAQKQVAIKSNMRFSSNGIHEPPKKKAKNPFGTYDVNSNIENVDDVVEWDESELNDSDYSVSDSEEESDDDVPLAYTF
ncbi:LOW QUALITY PROTEIN: uncharacterized protein LOC117639638 [Thrips palmi]|uniref:LOW QUALITY PROTEIN: uncharacterized protein LOC117639638 n=1 Tax=Thrips palmi TaxID=161013 RepID=A0A6P8ZH82_THRPL|nr:LOW QUALITY PROTEIN: uncharacterized protein LOC117639638 [Thrips palmi]